MTKPLGYEEDLVDLRFTQAQLDMMYFACLHDIGHPEMLEFEFKPEGLQTLLSGLRKIQALMDELGMQPTVLEAL